MVRCTSDCQLFNVNRPAIVKHIQNINTSGELNENATCSKMDQVGAPDPDELAEDIVENLETGLESFRTIITALKIKA